MKSLSSVRQALERDEVIEVVERPFEELIAMIHRGEINDGKTICALMLAYFRIKGER
jgi:hypothetical protein